MEWPIDFDKLDKDQIITQEQIESAYAVRYLDDPAKFSFAQMDLKSQIERRRPDLGGNVKCLRQGLRIMLDSEADDHQDKRYHATIQSLFAVDRRAKLIDRSGFDEARLAKCVSHDGARAAAILTVFTEEKKHHSLLAAIKREAPPLLPSR